MKKSTSASILFLTLLSTLSLIVVVSGDPKEVESWFETLNREKQPEKMSKLHFYFHDLSRGENATAVEVARTNTTSLPFPFSFLAVDDRLTLGPEFISKQVGYLRGWYGTASFEEVDLFMAMTFVFTDGIYNGSSLSVLGHNPHLHLYREVPVVGGSGRFRLARGVATLRTYAHNLTAGNYTVEVDIVVLHY